MVDDCGESSGSPADSARDIPVCVGALAKVPGDESLYVSVVIGSMDRGVICLPILWWIWVEKADTSFKISSLSALERYVAGRH